MAFTEWLSKNWILAIGLLIIASTFFAFFQKIIIVQFQWLGMFLLIVFGFAMFSNTKSKKQLKMLEAQEQAFPVINEYNPRNAKLLGSYRVNSRGELDIPKDGAWRIDYGGSPTSIVYIDPKNGEPFAYQGNVTNVKSPIEVPITPQFNIKYPKIKEKTEREIKPQE